MVLVEKILKIVGPNYAARHLGWRVAYEENLRKTDPQTAANGNQIFKMRLFRQNCNN